MAGGHVVAGSNPVFPTERLFQAGTAFVVFKQASGKQRSTRGRIPFVIVLVEEHENRERALQREKQIKSWKGGNAFRQLIAEVAPPNGGVHGWGYINNPL